MPATQIFVINIKLYLFLELGVICLTAKSFYVKNLHTLLKLF